MPIPISQNPNNDLWGFGTWDSNINDFTGWETETAGFSVSLSGLIDPVDDFLTASPVTDFRQLQRVRLLLLDADRAGCGS